VRGWGEEGVRRAADQRARAGGCGEKTGGVGGVGGQRFLVVHRLAGGCGLQRHLGVRAGRGEVDDQPHAGVGQRGGGSVACRMR
jgi:hypothetical protein